MAQQPKKGASNVRFSTIKSWVISNYRCKIGSSVKEHDVLRRLELDKENFDDGCVPSKIMISKAFNEGLGATKKRCGRGQGRYNIFSNVELNAFPCRELSTTPYYEWESLSNISVSSWSILREESDVVTFAKVEKQRLNDHRAVTEINVTRINDDKRVDFLVKYHERRVPDNILNKITNVFKHKSLTSQVTNLMRFMDTCYVCQGFEVGPDEDRIIIGEKTKVHLFSDQNLRGFSPHCDVVTNTGGMRCERCKELYLKSVVRKRKRHATFDGDIPKSTNHRFLTRTEITQKLSKQKKELQSALQSERRLREKLEKELLEMEEEDHRDLQKMFESVKCNDIPEDMMVLWDQQKKILKTHEKRQYRWHPKIMKLCMELYSKNPHVLDPLRHVICLPSNRTIRHWKNKIDQRPGWNTEMLVWCLNEAEKCNLREQDMWGGFILDEMKIQEDVQMVVKGGKHRLVGFVDLGQIHDDMLTISGTSSEEPKLASHVLQFIFLGDNGFRFPIAQFPSSSCSASSLQFIFWEGVRKMSETGFTIYYCILDGAEVNRQFIKVHFKDEQEAIDNMFTCPNPYGPYNNPMVFLMDPKHNIKKLRNNILKSSMEGKRCLTLGSKHILWDHFKSAFLYDQGSFSMSLHEKLTSEHFELTPSSKMRNHLAEDVLDRKMLALMKAYKEHLKNKPGQDETSLDETIKLLQHSSRMIQLFSDKYNLSSLSDSRLQHLRHFMKFIDDWKAEISGDNSKFISLKLYFDMKSMVLGFQAIIAIKTKHFPNAVVKPAITNQDVVENHFCQVRACNGQNNHPTWRLQEISQNTIRYGQTTISRKSNSGSMGLKRSQTKN